MIKLTTAHALCVAIQNTDSRPEQSAVWNGIRFHADEDRLTFGGIEIGHVYGTSNGVAIRFCDAATLHSLGMTLALQVLHFVGVWVQASQSRVTLPVFDDVDAEYDQAIKNASPQRND